MLNDEPNIRFSQLIAQCRRHYEDNEFDEIFELLSKYEIPKQSNIVLAKALWLRLKIDMAQSEGKETEEIRKKYDQMRISLDDAFTSLQDVYINSTMGYIESPSGFELVPKDNSNKNQIVVRRKKNILSFTKEKIISLNNFIGYIEKTGITRLESSGELQSINGMNLTWEGKAGSIVQINPNHDKSDLYLIFWPTNDTMFQLDPFVAFFNYKHRQKLEKITRGDTVVIRGQLEINKSSPKISLIKANILKHKPQGNIFKKR